MDVLDQGPFPAGAGVFAGGESFAETRLALEKLFPPQGGHCAPDRANSTSRAPSFSSAERVGWGGIEPVRRLRRVRAVQALRGGGVEADGGKDKRGGDPVTAAQGKFHGSGQAVVALTTLSALPFVE